MVGVSGAFMDMTIGYGSKAPRLTIEVLVMSTGAQGNAVKRSGDISQNTLSGCIYEISRLHPDKRIRIPLETTEQVVASAVFHV